MMPAFAKAHTTVQADTLAQAFTILSQIVAKTRPARPPSLSKTGNWYSHKAHCIINQSLSPLL